ncbi:PLP-dependent aminotransferase family protein [Acidihalobacter ferrooxydans]|uniref:GntR family transcriptional regulator n=1 Tax=Acidihalobacter ferrooxydans TaxID=1765967 RepID=A0A1P8UH95_9GAMM|nr:PLP-dependent aminotransferase family protein [Acidihalobacter ferrooxydans]APZ43199.1 GntR family transcriptional regulator [Acidihalobacter ferrooxydans]
MTHLYEAVASELETRIDNGSYRPGDRLPGVRRLSTQFGVSISTAVEACRLLEDRGRLEVRPRSGYYVRLPQHPPRREPSASRPPAEPHAVTGQHLVLQIARAANGPDNVQLAAAVPDVSFLPITAVNRTMAEVARKYPAAGSRYEFSPGNLALRRQIARRMADLRCAVGPEDIVVTSGAQESLALALRAVASPGQVVAIESPAFYGLLQVIEASGLQALEIPTHPREGIALDALQLAVERWPVAACVVVSNFSNPLGFCMSEARKQALVKLLSARGIPLIEDDVYGELGFGLSRPGVAKAWDAAGDVIYCSSFSKTLSPGMRLGWIAPGRYRARIEYDKYLLNLASATLPQLAVAQLLERGGYDRYLRQVRRQYAAAVTRVADAVELLFPEGTRVSHPQGGFVLWVEMPAQVDALTLHRLAFAERIIIAPGPIFSASGKYPHHIRLNCALPWDARIQRSLRRLGELARALANGPGPTVEAK